LVSLTRELPIGEPPTGSGRVERLRVDERGLAPEDAHVAVVEEAEREGGAGAEVGGDEGGDGRGETGRETAGGHQGEVCGGLRRGAHEAGEVVSWWWTGLLNSENGAGQLGRTAEVVSITVHRENRGSHAKLGRVSRV